MKHLINFSQFLTEGIKLVNGKPDINFEYDSPDDIIKLANAPNAKFNTYNNKVKMYSGYIMEKAHGEEKVELMDLLKEPESITDSDLKRLIKSTYPTNMIGIKVELIIPAGSSSTLALRIANTIKELYYPKAKVIDILKRFYTIPMSIVNWEEYLRADPTTREQLDSYLKNHVSSYWNGPAALDWSKQTGEHIENWPGMENFKTSQSTEFTGFIKKSSGLRSGSRKLLNPGHNVDEYIINTIEAANDVFNTLKKGLKSADSYSIAAANTPYFMIVDDMMLGGTTLKGIVDNITATLKEQNLTQPLENISTYSLIKYSESTTAQTEEQKRAAAERAEARKAKQKEIEIRCVDIFKDAKTAAQQSNIELTKIIKSIIDSENQKELAKPKEDRAKFTVDMVNAAATNAQLL